MLENLSPCTLTYQPPPATQDATFPWTYFKYHETIAAVTPSHYIRIVRLLKHSGGSSASQHLALSVGMSEDRQRILVELAHLVKRYTVSDNMISAIQSPREAAGW